MRIFLLLLFSATLSTHLCAQDSTITPSAFETFGRQPGRILKTQTVELGPVSNIAVSRIRTIDVRTKDTVQAIRINYDYINRQLLLTHPSVLYIDMHDLDTVIQTLTYFLQESKELKPTTPVQYSYLTNADLHLFAEYTPYSDSWSFGLEKIYQKLRISVSSSAVSWNRRRANDLLQLLIQAKSSRW